MTNHKHHHHCHPAACFGPDVRIWCAWKGLVRMRNICAGDEVYTLDGWKSVLWAGGAEIKVTEKNRPVLVRGEVYSPQHLILNEEGKWVKAKFLAEFHIGDAGYISPAPARQWYGHILLERHSAIETEALFTESLNPTDRALSGMTPEMRAQIRDALDAAGIDRSQYPGPSGRVLTRRDMREIYGGK